MMTQQGDATPARIVVGYDGSSDSKYALEWAARQAEVTGVHLELVATWTWPTGLGWSVIPSTGFDPAEGIKAALDEAVRDLQNSHRDVKTSVRIVQGSPSLTLVEVSRGAELLVVGTRGHGEVAGLLIGSVSQYCVAHAHCPVVVIRSTK